MNRHFAQNVNGPIGAASQRILDHALRPRWPHRNYDYFTAHLLFDPQGFFERIAVRFVYFELQVRFLDPGRVFVDAQDRVFVRDLLHENQNFHGYARLWRASINRLKHARGVRTDYSSYRLNNNAAFVPPKPKLFESA